jgi:hypothetical protein
VRILPRMAVHFDTSGSLHPGENMVELINYFTSTEQW